MVAVIIDGGGTRRAVACDGRVRQVGGSDEGVGLKDTHAVVQRATLVPRVVVREHASAHRPVAAKDEDAAADDGGRVSLAVGGNVTSPVRDRKRRDRRRHRVHVEHEERRANGHRRVVLMLAKEHVDLLVDDGDSVALARLAQAALRLRVRPAHDGEFIIVAESVDL